MIGATRQPTTPTPAATRRPSRPGTVASAASKHPGHHYRCPSPDGRLAARDATSHQHCDAERRAVQQFTVSFKCLKLNLNYAF